MPYILDMVLSRLFDPSVFKILLSLLYRLKRILGCDKASLLIYSLIQASSVYKLFKCLSLAGVL